MMTLLLSIAANVMAGWGIWHFGISEKINNARLRPVLPQPDKVVVTYLKRGNQEVTFTERDARLIYELYEKLPTGPEYQAACHDPGFILRFEAKEKIYHSISVCYDCGNYTIEGEDDFVGFDAKSTFAKFLLDTVMVKAPSSPGEPEK